MQCFLPFDSFDVSPLPGSVEAYLDYRRRAIAFITARNRRIAGLRLASG